MPIPQDIYKRVMITRFHKRQAVVFATLVLSFFLVVYQIAAIYWAAPSPSSSISIRDRVTICFMALLTAIIVAYTTYRCPNCNSRPLGKHWPGFNPRRCPSCKVGLH